MDNLIRVWNKFHEERTVDLFNRFRGLYRAAVVETNDPLQLGRLRIFIPELHEDNLLRKPEHLPWAVAAPWLGGKGCGSWHNAIIGDIVFVIFEKGHAYSPIVVGFADPTRRGFYAHQSIHGPTPVPIDEDGNVTGEPRDDFIDEFLPVDGRPMSIGYRDRYGSFFMLNSVGFFPSEHAQTPASAGFDAIAEKDFDASLKQAKVNEPDTKYSVLHTKYGNIMIFSDVGYKWDNEFSGDFDQDLRFEESRSKYISRLLNEDQPKDTDQRRIEFRTRYGHKFEMRDVGWPKTRTGEYGQQVEVAEDRDIDERWMKLRTKGGHVLQMLDTGFDSEDDLFIKRLLKSEIGSSTELEDQMSDDRRMIRLITRHGFRMALDDRGSDPKNASQEDGPIGNGFIVKGVRDGRGFGIEFNEKTAYNRLMMYTPKSKGLVLDDRLDYIMMHTDTFGDPISELVSPVDRYKDNAFARSTGLTKDAESNTYHLKLDNINRYVRLKTPQQQGIESRDEGGPCGTWSESRDAEGRAIFMSKSDQFLVIRDRGVRLDEAGQAGRRPVEDSEQPEGTLAPGSSGTDVDNIEGNAAGLLHQKFIILDDRNRAIIVKNFHSNGKIQIICPNGDIELAGRNIRLNASNNIELNAGVEICQQARDSQFVVRNGHVGTNTELRARRINCVTMFGTHEQIQIPLHPLAPAAPGIPTACSSTPIREIKRTRVGPREFNVEQGCAPNKIEAGPVPIQVRQGGGDSPPPAGDGGGGAPQNPPATPTPPELPFVPNPTPEPDNFEQITDESGSGGVLWYGTSTKFLQEIQEAGLFKRSFANNDNIPPNLDAELITLAFSESIARGEGGKILRPGENFAALAKKRYGGESLILRIFQVPEPDKLSKVENNPDIFEYTGDNIPPDLFDIFLIGTDTFEGTPLFPDVI